MAQAALKIESEIINPQKYFEIPYSEILANIQDGTLTHREKIVLLKISQCGYESGAFYPKQITIAEKADITPYHLRTLLKSLEGKGFILRDVPTLEQRRTHRFSSRYFFLNHPVYAEAENGKIHPEPFIRPELRVIKGGKKEQNTSTVKEENSLSCNTFPDTFPDTFPGLLLIENQNIKKNNYTENKSEYFQNSESPVVVFSDILNNPPPVETAKNPKTDELIKSDNPVKESEESQSAEPISSPVITKINPETEEAKINQNVEPIPPACKENNPEPETEELLKQVKSGIPVTPNLRKIIRDGIKKHGVDYVRKCIEYVNGRSTTNYPGYLNMAIRGNWVADWVSPAEKRQAQVKAEQEKARREAEKQAEFQRETDKLERERQERESFRDKFIALPQADKEALSKDFFNDPAVNFFMKKEARKRPDISESPSFVIWLKSSGRMSA